LARRPATWSAGSPGTRSTAVSATSWERRCCPARPASSRSTTAKTDVVDKALVSAVRKSAAQIGGGGAKQLKAALAEAQAGMGGG
jgi:hypothetical protein